MKILIYLSAQALMIMTLGPLVLKYKMKKIWNMEARWAQKMETMSSYLSIDVIIMAIRNWI